jgi:hypothetical protein
VNVLTKIFVSLLIVLSLFLSAATITFVSAIDDWKAGYTAKDTEIAQLRASKAELETAASAAEASASEMRNAVASQVEALNTQLANARRDMSELAQQLADAKSTSTIAQANVSKLTSATSALQASNSAYQQQLAVYRSENDRLQTQNGDLNIALSDVRNKLDVTEEARRVLAEQLVETRTTNDRLSGTLRDRGIDPTRIATAGLAAGAPPINGVIRETRQIAGVPHAKISIGSDDAVKIGMEFTILERASGKFLGKLTIVAVEPNEAVGRLVGPDLGAIAAGAEVRTQL